MIDNKKQLIDYNIYELNNNTIKTYDINNDYSYDYNSLDNLFNKDVVKKYNFKNHTNEFLITHLTKNTLYNIFDSNKKQDFDQEYLKQLTRSYIAEYTKGVITKPVIKKTVKYIGKKPLILYNGLTNYSSCMVYEGNFLSEKEMLNYKNLKIAQNKCKISTLYNEITGNFDFTQKFLGNIISTSTDIYYEKQYYKNKNVDFNFIQKFYNNLELKIYNNFRKPIFNFIDNYSSPIDNFVNYYVDKSLDKIIYYVDNSLDKIYDYTEKLYNFSKDSYNFFNETYNIYNETYNNFRNDVINYGIELYDTSKQTFYNLVDNETPKLEYISNGNNFKEENLNIDLKPEDLETYSIDNIVNNILENKVSEIRNKKDISLILNQNINEISRYLTTVSKFVGLCNLLKNFKDMDIKTRIVEVQSFIISLKTDDRFVNGLYTFMNDIVKQGEIKVKNLVNLGVSLAEKYLDLPLKSACKFISNIVKGESVKEYFKPLLMDIVSIFVPQVSLLNMMKGIVEGIESFFSEQSIKNINGIDCLYTDKFEIGFFKVRHKITYENEFFGISVSYTSRHASDGKKYCEEDFKRQLDYKVYEVIGIPIEFVNNTVEKTDTRIGNYTLKQYLDNFKNKWLEINDKYLNENDKKLIQNMYFESEEDKNYRYDLAKKGKAPSWYWNNKKDNIIEFTKKVYNKIKTKYENTNITNLSELEKFIIDLYHELFDLNKTKKNKDLGKTESENQNKIFENCRDKRLKENGNLDNNRDVLLNFCINEIEGNLVKLQEYYDKLTDTEKSYLSNRIVKYCIDYLEEQLKELKDEYDEYLNSSNKELDDYLYEQRDDYKNLENNYSREIVIFTVCYDLLKRQQSVEYIVESGFSSFIGYMGSYIAYIDYEINLLLKKPMKYPFIKIYDYCSNFVQGYITRVLNDQVILYISLSEITDNLTDEYLNNYIVPFVSGGIGISIGIVRCLFSPNKKNFKNLVINGSIKAINSSFYCIYNYLKITYKNSFINSNNWEVFVQYLTKGMNKLFNIGFTIDFISAVSLVVLFNLGIRITGKIFNMFLKSKTKKSIFELNIENTITKNTLELEKTKNIVELEKTKNVIELENTKNLIELVKTKNIVELVKSNNYEPNILDSYKLKKYSSNNYNFNSYNSNNYNLSSYEISSY